MSQRTTSALLAAATASLLWGCGASATKDSEPTPSAKLSPDTPAAKGNAGPITWAMYRDVQTIDPVKAADFPENTSITTMCDSLLRQQPDGTITPGLAARVEAPDDRTLVLELDGRATFWDGSPVSAEDVLYSLRRHVDPAQGGFYAKVFERVSDMAATGPKQVTITLAQPDTSLRAELSQMAGVVVKKSFAEQAGQDFGAPSGGTMCSGAFKLKDWDAGSALVVEANADYWDPALRPKVSQITLRGVPDEASLTSGLLTGEIDGGYVPPLSGLDQLRSSEAVKVYSGPSFATDTFIVSDLKGTLGDVRVRQALSMAIDRKAYVKTIYKGAAQLPRTIANPGTWGYAPEEFDENWNGLPDPAFDVARALELVKAAGAVGKSLTIGLSSEVAITASGANAIRSAGEAIGLDVRLESSSAADYINLFIDPKAREGLDGFMTFNYSRYADPAAFYSTFVLEGGDSNYAGFSDAQLTRDLEAARTTSDEKERARIVIRAGERMNELLPWIPLAQPSSTLVMNREITGAPASFAYMGGPWANYLGAAG